MTTALLVIDMQAVFAPMTTSALPNILRLTAHFQTLSLPLIFTQEGHTKAEFTPSFKAEFTPPLHNQLVRKWGPSGCIAIATSDWELLPKISGEVEKTKPPVVGKNTYDVFLNMKLEELLKEKEVERVVVCGVMTDCCCDTTARSAFNRGYETWLLEDACGIANKKQHEAGLRGFGYAFGEVLGTAEILKRVK